MIQQITVFLENKEGRLSAMCQVLADANIDMKALTIAETTDYGLIRIVADKPQEALEALKAADYRAICTDVLAVSLADKPGTLAALLAFLDSMDVNIEYGYCFSYKGEKAIDVLKIRDADVAEVAIKAAGYKLLDPADL